MVFQLLTNLILIQYNLKNYLKKDCKTKQDHQLLVKYLLKCCFVIKIFTHTGIEYLIEMMYWSVIRQFQVNWLTSNLNQHFGCGLLQLI